MTVETVVHTESPTHLTLDIVRETNKVGAREWLNRYCRDAQTKAEPDHEIVVRRGGESGPVIATGRPCLEKEGVTDVSLSQEHSTLSLEHFDRKFFHVHDKTMFTYHGKKYHWKGHSELLEDETQIVLASFHATWFDSRMGVKGVHLGKLEITYDGLDLIDLVVISAMVVQERADEELQSVWAPPFIAE